MDKNERKLVKLFNKADDCTSRKESKKLILKADKLRAKIIAKKLLEDAS